LDQGIYVNFYPIYEKNGYGYIVNVYSDIASLIYIQDIRNTWYGISIVVLNALTNKILSEQQNEYARKYNWSIMGCNRYIYIYI